MGDSNTALKEWLRSKPTKIDQGTFLQMMKLAAKALDEADSDIAQLKTALNASDAALATAENQITDLAGRVALLEAL